MTAADCVAAKAPGVAEAVEGADGRGANDDLDAMRADIYALLAALLRRAPDRGVLDFLRAIEVDVDVDADIDADLVRGPDAHRSMAQAWRDLSAAARAAQPEAVEDEYVVLFVGVGQGEVTPFASWYHEGALCGAPLVALRDELARLGLARAHAVCEPEDHISAVCEVMSHLISVGAPRSAQADFYGAHLAAWAPRLFEDVARAASADFYQAVGALGQAFMAIESSLNQPDIVR